MSVPDQDPLPGMSPPPPRRVKPPLEFDGIAFEKWWKAYPRKVGKAAAKVAYAKAARKVGHERLYEALVAQQSSLISRERGFVPHPSTWLNGERWADEVTQAPTYREPWE